MYSVYTSTIGLMTIFHSRLTTKSKCPVSKLFSAMAANPSPIQRRTATVGRWLTVDCRGAANGNWERKREKCHLFYH